jgi:hypothetical protein
MNTNGRIRKKRKVNLCGNKIGCAIKSTEKIIKDE